MEYMNNIRTGFSVKIDEETGDFTGILRTGKYHKKDKAFSGNIKELTCHEKLCIEGILESAYPEKGKSFCQAYRKLLPGFEGLIYIVEA